MVCCLVKADGDSEALSLAASENCINADFRSVLLKVGIIACVRSVIGHMMNDAIPTSSDDDNDETAKRERYHYCSLEGCSDPELWMESHHQSISINDGETGVAQSSRLGRRPSTLLCFVSLSKAFGSLREIMTRQQRGRRHEVLHQLFFWCCGNSMKLVLQKMR